MTKSIKTYKGYDLNIISKKTIKKAIKWDKLFNIKYEINKKAWTNRIMKKRARISKKMDKLKVYKNALINYHYNYNIKGVN